ncbi:alpha/beta fold hydrolase [Microbacterium sp. SS28]|uniref:alpha/beta fold hydrolase n=1 Tax=Microbacterium sp. SS28 TaxID=2919948 RepID=UPI001FA984AD|nr:alpha/beta hydrolase [Microbacterium sp. SS28]
MAEVVVGGVRIAYRRRGSGPPLLLFHGAWEDSRVWAGELERLSPQVDVVAWDAPGCGNSDDVPRGWANTDWADAASGFIAALGLTTPAVAGFSFGSMLALLLAREHPGSVGRLVLIGASAGWGGSLDADRLAQRIASTRFTMEHPLDEWADELIDTMLAADASPERRSHLRSLVDDWRPATMAAVLDVMLQDLRPGLRTIRTPTVVVRGTADARSPRSASLELCELLPHARFEEISGAGHDCTGPDLDAVLLVSAHDAGAEAAPPPPRHWRPDEQMHGATRFQQAR